jgi:hypothetical protein
MADACGLPSGSFFGDTPKRVEEGRRNLGDYVQNPGLPTLSLYYEDFVVDRRAAIGRPSFNLEERWTLYVETLYEPISQ